jgi:hypothetical protein
MIVCDEDATLELQVKTVKVSYQVTLLALQCGTAVLRYSIVLQIDRARCSGSGIRADSTFQDPDRSEAAFCVGATDRRRQRCQLPDHPVTTTHDIPISAQRNASS